MKQGHSACMKVPYNIPQKKKRGVSTYRNPDNAHLIWYSDHASARRWLKIRQGGLAVVLGVACGVSAICAVQAGTIVPRMQARSVQISYNDGGTPASDKATAVAFEPFTKTLNFARGAGFDVDRVQASQDSQINPETITATGGVVVSLGLGFVADAKGQSDFSVTFRVLQPVSYSVNGSISWDELFPDVTSESPTVKLTGAQGVIYQSDPALPDATPFDYTKAGVLQPGEYVLEAHANAFIPSGGGGATKNYSLNFGVIPNGPVGPGFGNVYRSLRKCWHFGMALANISG